MVVEWLDLSYVVRDIILGFVGEYEWKSFLMMLVAKNWRKKRDGIIRYQPVQWLDLPDAAMDNLHEYIGDDNWKLYNLLLVSKNWWKTDDHEVSRYKLGTIVLEPQRISRSLYEPKFRKTFAAVVSLLTHSSVHKISPDQYKIVDRPRDIRSFQLITDQAFGLLLQQMRNLGMQRNGQRLRYKNVTTLDLTDDSNWDVDNTVWRSEEMDETYLFKPQIPLLPTNGAPFAAYLFLWFFPNVTSFNLSRTKWSDSASRLINFSQIIQLIWRNSYITTASFLSPLFACTNLVELQLDNSTFRLPWIERGQPWFWMDIGEDGDFPYNVFQNLDNCNQLTKFSCSNCMV